MLDVCRITHSLHLHIIWVQGIILQWIMNPCTPSTLNLKVRFILFTAIPQYLDQWLCKEHTQLLFILSYSFPRLFNHTCSFSIGSDLRTLSWTTSLFQPGLTVLYLAITLQCTGYLHASWELALSLLLEKQGINTYQLSSRKYERKEEGKGK